MSFTDKYSLETIGDGLVDWNEVVSTNLQKIDEHVQHYDRAVAGVPLSHGDCVFINQQAYYQPASCETLSHWVMGIVEGTTPAGMYVNVVSIGGITYSGWNWTPGLPIFAGITPGELTQIDPDYNPTLAGVTYHRTIVGFAKSSDAVYVRPFRTTLGMITGVTGAVGPPGADGPDSDLLDWDGNDIILKFPDGTVAERWTKT